MKKVIVATLVGLMALGTLAGCGDNEDPTPSTTAPTDEPVVSVEPPEESTVESVNPTEVGEEFPG